jgi:hypothetical protein
MTLCISILLYGIISWGGSTRTDRNTLHITQKIDNKNRVLITIKIYIRELFNHTNILSIYKLFIRQILIKCIQNHTLNAR